MISTGSRSKFVENYNKQTIMKKFYLSAAALLATTMLSAQAFWTPTTYKGAFPVTDNTPATDWTDTWANFDPENTNYATTTSTLSGDITANQTISGVVYLDGFVHVKNNAVLTIQPGTVIRGKNDPTTPGVLIITRGAKIMAQGTAAQPIVFTSNETVANGRNPGDWGGLVICGYGIINTGGISQAPNVSKIEGFVTTSPDRYYGGTNNADNSGVLSYVRIEFGGVALDPAVQNSEINGLTLAGVGSGTQIDHVQVSFSGDDSFEWFGGAVDSKYLIAYRGTDDDFDCDFGFQGRVQFGLGVKDANISDVALANGESNGFEVDNTAASPYFALPLTKPVFSNMTVVGAKRDGSTTIPGGDKHECAMHIRRNTGIRIFNSLFLGFEKGWRLQQAVTKDNFDAPAASDSVGVVANSNITADIGATYITDGTAVPQTWYHNYSTANNNDTVTTVTQIDFVSGFPASLATKPDFRLKATTTVGTGAAFTHAVFVGGFVGISKTNFTDKMVTVYPNPASDVANLVIDASSTSVITVTVFDVTGKAVSIPVVNHNLALGENTFSINTANLMPGVYFVTINSASGKETVKLAVSK
ncbi:MAG: hypothetical protein K0S32_1683 [Bacteroidetes bacterium]|jgi:hypothetical protein|nr:hypothetical protein [Bacteroidota bacterium]